MKTELKKAVLFVFLLIAAPAFAQIYEPEDSVICEQIFEYARVHKLADLPIGEIMVQTGKQFLGYPYQAGTLDEGSPEALIVNLRGLDCTTFMESVFALSRCIKLQKTTFAGFLSQLKLIRYRSGVIDRYPSRLHYITDWLYENSQKGIVTDATPLIGGTAYPVNLFFMSKNSEKYPKLVETPAFIPMIKETEEAVTARNYFYIPKSQIKELESGIHPGDIIAITTNIAGLDVVHIGIAVAGNGGRIHLLHSPQVGATVQITKNPLSEYLKKNKVQTGIIVIRPVI